MTEPSNQSSATASHRLVAWAVGLTALVSAPLGALGHAALAGPGDEVPEQWQDRPLRGTTPLSGEAYNGCVLLGMTDAEIRKDRERCLVAYWTPARLRATPELLADWAEDNEAAVPPSPGQAVSPDSPDSTALPPLPGDDDPWWAEQALRRPGRTTPAVDIF